MNKQETIVVFWHHPKFGACTWSFTNEEDQKLISLCDLFGIHFIGKGFSFEEKDATSLNAKIESIMDKYIESIMDKYQDSLSINSLWELGDNENLIVVCCPEEGSHNRYFLFEEDREEDFQKAVKDLQGLRQEGLTTTNDLAVLCVSKVIADLVHSIVRDDLDASEFSYSSLVEQGVIS